MTPGAPFQSIPLPCLWCQVSTSPSSQVIFLEHLTCDLGSHGIMFLRFTLICHRSFLLYFSPLKNYNPALLTVHF